MRGRSREGRGEQRGRMRQGKGHLRVEDGVPQLSGDDPHIEHATEVTTAVNAPTTQGRKRGGVREEEAMSGRDGDLRGRLSSD
jgi:hypothetical protein